MRLLIFAIVVIAALSMAHASAQEDGVVLVGAGDVGSCDNENAEATGQLIEQIAGTVFIPGDIAYEDGTEKQFAECFDPAWGSFKDRTQPVPGNHEYHTNGASGYFDYFGAAAGDPDKGYYSYDLGGWHIVALNSNCDAIGGCGTGSAQERWLRDDLAEHRVDCTLAYWHHPRFSSGTHGNDGRSQALWQALYEHGADVVVAGHDHDYERFAPQDPQGEADAAFGMREFVVGTGGKSLRDFENVRVNSEVRNAETYGVIKFLLQANGYTWVFVPVNDGEFVDSGRASCHGAPSATPAPLPVPSEGDTSGLDNGVIIVGLAAGAGAVLLFATLWVWWSGRR